MASTALVSWILISGKFISHLIRRQRPEHVCAIRITALCVQHFSREDPLMRHTCQNISISQIFAVFWNKRFSFWFHSETRRENSLKSSSDSRLSVPNTWGSICQIHSPQSDRVYYPGEQPGSAQRLKVCVACVCFMCICKDLQRVLWHKAATCSGGENYSCHVGLQALI